MLGGGGEIEKKVAWALECIGQSAAILSEAGNAVQTMSHAMQKEGLSGLLQQEPWKQAAVAQPPMQLSRKSVAAQSRFAPQNVHEKRAILQVRLERAMREQDIRRVQQISRDLDEIDGPADAEDVARDSAVLHLPRGREILSCARQGRNCSHKTTASDFN